MKKIIISLSLFILLAFASCSNTTQENSGITDSYGNEVPKYCSSWYDGCNSCSIGENGQMACTLMYCSEESLQEPECREYDYPNEG